MSEVAGVQALFGPFERGEVEDLDAFFEGLADDVVYANAVGSLDGKALVRRYFDVVAELVDADPYRRPLAYFAGDDGRVAVLGLERFAVRATGATVVREFVWILDVRDGLITRIGEVQDLAGVSEVFEDAWRRATTGV